MANVFDQFDTEQNVFDQFDDVKAGIPQAEITQGPEVSFSPDSPPVPGGQWMAQDDPNAPPDMYPGAVGEPLPPERGIVDMFTGESLMTPKMRNLQEIGQAPELNEMSVPAFKAAFGLSFWPYVYW